MDKDEGGYAAAYFFCSFTNFASQDPVKLIGSLLVQLCNDNPTLWTDIDARYRTEIAKRNAFCKSRSLGEVKGMLHNALGKLHNVYILVDALNESSQSVLMLSTLWDLVEQQKGVRLMFSSTEGFFLPPTKQSSPLLKTVPMTSLLVNDDIKVYVEFCLANNDRLSRLPSTLKDKIRSKLLSGADGMSA